MFVTGILILTQLGATYFLGTSTSFFFAMINSQQNLSYMPLMSVNTPAYAN